MELMTIYGEEIEDGILLNVSITQSRLAEMVGATRVTVNKELAHMESDGVLKRVERKIIILRRRPAPAALNKAVLKDFRHRLPDIPSTRSCSVISEPMEPEFGKLDGFCSVL